MTKLRKAAKGRQCLVRIPGICNANPETVVLAHYRLNSGAGRKPHDLAGAWCCSSCHDEIDGRTRILDNRALVRLYHAEGVMRTIDALDSEELI